MKKVRNLLGLITIFMISMLSFCNYSFAVHDTNGKTLGLYNNGNTRPTGYYTIGNEKHTKSIPVIKIVEYNGTGKGEATIANQAIYCLKDGVGFGATEEGTSSAQNVKYTEYFDLKKPDEIKETYKTDILPPEEDYNKLIWLLDNICIPEDVASVDKLLAQANLSRADFESNNGTKMTNDEFKDIIEVIQQSAIWFITNKNDEYQPSKEGTFHFSEDISSEGTDIDDKYSFDIDSPIGKLYKYLIEESEKHTEYDYNLGETNENDGIVLEKENAKTSLEGENYYVGPYKITKTDDIFEFNVKIVVDNNENDTITLVNSDKTQEIEGASITEKINSVLGEEFYIKLPVGTSANNVSIEVTGKKEVKKLTYWSTGESSAKNNQPVVIIEKEDKNFKLDDTQKIERTNFDLALRKFISEVNGTPVTPPREPNITQESLRALATGEKSILDNGTTSTKTHTKDPVSIKKGDKVIYTIRVYNEGEIDGYAEEIMDYLPEGLKLVPDTESEINKLYGWKADEDDPKIIRTKYLSRKYKNGVFNESEPDNEENLLKAFNKEPDENEKYSMLSYKDVKVECVVDLTTQLTDNHLKNVAEITETYNDSLIADRDSQAGNLSDEQKNAYSSGTSTQGKGYQDDDDYEDLILVGKYFDLALRKFITAVNGLDLSTNGKYDREPNVDVSPLLEGSTTASYKHTKTPISVSVGDVVTYTLRIYNEGQIAGYADEIVDHLPPELEFLPDDELNKKYLWLLDSSDTTQRTIKTTYLSKEHDLDNVIEPFDSDNGELAYQEVQVRCKVTKTAQTLKRITNIAEITKSSNDDNLADRDNEKNVTLPQDSDLPDYRGKETNPSDLSYDDRHYEGQEDDDDFEKLILEKFDLALRKFITGVNDQNITDREPKVDTSKYGIIENEKEITDMEYEHTKEPVRVCQNDIITYTIRVYNEGTKAGYASEIKDDIPDGLEYVLENEINSEYGWVLYDAEGNETAEVKEGVTIRTNYLSKENEETEGENLLQGFDRETMDTPDYRDVQVAFRVKMPNTEDRIITNHAEISKDTDKDGNEVEDEDSTPDEWNDEDDEDEEHIYVKYFDLSLKKWVSQVILIEDGVQKEMETGHTPDQNPEPVVKVELNKKRIENTIIKFRYQIRVTNEGEIEGYATEISDYIPDGLKFNQADNPKWRETNGKIVTDQLNNTLLQPGESATIDVILTWINDPENLNQKVNVAEISEDDNPSDTPDIDSTPNNKKDGEDDIDDAPVVLGVVTGVSPTNITLIISTILIVGIGAFIIKRYVV